MNFFNEANRLYNEKDYLNAIEFYEKSIEAHENEGCSYYNAGVCYIKLKEFDSGIKMLKLALTFDKISKYYFNLAYCYAMKDLLHKAIIYFNTAWCLDNSDTECEKALNLILEKTRKTLIN